MNRSVTAFAPATVANVGCGYDIFGFAIEQPGDEVTVSFSETKDVRITEISGDGGRLPKEAEINTAGFAVLHFLKKIQDSRGIDIQLKKGLPLGSGMGSSAASSVAALASVNRLFNNPLSKKELLPIAMAAEKLACGAAHADNVAPALFGGFILIRENDPPDIIELPVPEGLFCTIIHPEIEIRTLDARRIIEPYIPLPDAVRQWANTAGVVAGLYNNDPKLIGRSMTDHIIEPRRAGLIPHFYEIKEKVIENGALGCSISGSGPSIFCLSTSTVIARKLADQMKDVFSRHSIICQTYISKINTVGARILKE
ncbi:MAG: homoserine kinase [Candidatus Marinimicrobia bacterium]|nr:homoserine kinase [Candidatus Neomarinimicrobiota bacterium]RKY56568.1 MAG: homoserine kinase [Candidatus Neomarinimicrobiota bacterium]